MMRKQGCNDCVFFSSGAPVYYRFDVCGVTMTEETEMRMNKRANRLSKQAKVLQFKKMMTLFFIEQVSNRFIALDVDKGVEISC